MTKSSPFPKLINYGIRMGLLIHETHSEKLTDDSVGPALANPLKECRHGCRQRTQQQNKHETPEDKHVD